MRALRLALLPLGIAFGLAAERAAYDGGERALAAADLAVGVVLVACGVVAWDRRPESRVGALMSLAGFSWFLGTLWSPALFLHRGPLVHLHLSYPTGRLPSPLARGVVVAAYLVAAVEPLAGSDAATLALSVLVALAAVQVFVRTSGPARKAGGPALAAALAFAGVLALGAVERVTGWDAARLVLWTYDAVIVSVAIVLFVDLLRGRWADAVVTGLVVDLGAPAQAGTLRGKLARALGDPSLELGYRLPETGRFVDDSGRPVELPPAGSGRTATPIEDRGEQVAVLVHDEAVLADKRLVESVAAAARIAVANARLQAEARARTGELEASRRRIVETADAQRRRLERELRAGVDRRLRRVATLLAEGRAAAPARDVEAFAALEAELGEVQREVDEFARGVHPGALTDGGLAHALGRLAERSQLPVQVTGHVGPLPGPVEAALFFVCSEALANVTKHSGAAHVAVELAEERGEVVLTVADDGVGGAGPGRGSGLRGLADRVEALGGRFSIDSPAGQGTLIVARIPLGG